MRVICRLSSGVSCKIIANILMNFRNGQRLIRMSVHGKELVREYFAPMLPRLMVFPIAFLLYSSIVYLATRYSH